MKRATHSIILVLLILTILPGHHTAQASTNTVDSAGVGLYTSLALDSSGYPVISYYDNTNGDLKLAHCNDPACAGGDESIVTVDSTGWVGGFTSLALDSSGYPVISYWDNSNGALKLAHCNDPNCVGGDESLATVDSVGSVGMYTSLTLDSSGNPVISYWDNSNGALKLAHCNDVNCTGGDESIVTLDSAGNVGTYTSLALDSSGNPVISYHDSTNGDLKLAHCNDVNCTGGDESIVTVDNTGDVGEYTSLALDSSGYPVISYFDDTNDDLKLAHCNDPNCTGGDESIVTLDSAGDVGGYTSLALDSSGCPVISYWDDTNDDLKLARCNDPNCTGGDERFAAVDSAGDVGKHTALVLDSTGDPVISYFDQTNYALKLYRAPAVTLGFGSASSSVSESDGTAAAVTLTVSDGPANGTYTADVTYGGTATGGGVDYTGPATVTFDCTAGCADGTYTQDLLTLINDGIDEPDETVLLTLSNPTGIGASLAAIATHTVTITDARVPAEPAPDIAVFDPAISKLGVLEPGQLGLPGEQLTWTITVVNQGSAGADDVVVTDTLIPALRIDSVSTERGSFSIDGQTVTVSLGQLDPGDTVTIQIVTTVLDGAPSPVTNSATVSGGDVTASASATADTISTLPSTGYGQ